MPIRLADLEQNRTRPTRWRIYATERGREIALTRYIKLGYLYFVRWTDARGYGLQAMWRAEWQDDNSKAVIR